MSSGTYAPFNPRPASPPHPITSSIGTLESAVLTVRIIKSFPYRTMKALVLPSINFHTTTVGELKKLCQDTITEGKVPGFRPFKTCVNDLDTIKIYTHAHGSKTMNLIINLTNDDTEILSDDSKTLELYGLENESEVSFFIRKDYDDFKLNPETKWD